MTRRALVGVFVALSVGLVGPSALQQVNSLCGQPALCLGTGSAAPLEFWTDGVPRFSIDRTGAMTAQNGGSISGAALGDLNASNLTSGTVPDARFPATLPALNGSALTALNASALASGTLPDARFPAVLPAASGAALTALNASALASGTVAFARGGTPFVFIGKTVTQTIGNSTTLENDNAFTFSIAAAEDWVLDFTLSMDGTVAGDVKFNLSVPANVTFNIFAQCLALASTTNVGDIKTTIAGAGNDLTCGMAGVGAFITHQFRARVTSTTGTGTVVLQWAKNASDATDTKMYAGSYMTRMRVQ